MMLSVFARGATNAPTAPAEPKSVPTISVLGGDNQTGTPGDFNVKPFDLAVWNAAGTEPLVDAEVTFTVQSGGGLLAPTKDAVVPSNTLTLKTDQDGTVQAYYRQPFVAGLLSQIKATVGEGEILLQTTSLAPGESLDHNTGSTRNQSTTTKSGTRSGGGGSGVVISFVGSGTVATSKSSTIKAKVAALAVSATQVVLKTPTANYAVNTSTWAISSYTGQ
jgi:hypothetical protein